MGTAASVRDDRSPDQTPASVRTNFFFKPPLNFGYSKDLSDRKPSVEVQSESNYETTEKDIQLQTDADYGTNEEKFSEDVFERSSTIDGQHRVHLTESGRQSLKTFIKAE